LQLSCGPTTSDRLEHNRGISVYKCYFCHHFQAGTELGGAGGGTAPQNFAWPPSGFPKFFRSPSESPTQTFDSSPCRKTGPSSGPPNENVWLHPCFQVTQSNLNRCSN